MIFADKAYHINTNMWYTLGKTYDFNIQSPQTQPVKMRQYCDITAYTNKCQTYMVYSDTPCI